MGFLVGIIFLPLQVETEEKYPFPMAYFLNHFPPSKKNFTNTFELVSIFQIFGRPGRLPHHLERGGDPRAVQGDHAKHRQDGHHKRGGDRGLRRGQGEFHLKKDN